MRALNRIQHLGPGAGILAVAGLMAFALLCAATEASWTSAQVTNSTSNARTGGLAFTHAYQSTSCSGGPAVTATLACAGSIAPTSPVPASGTTTGADAITNNGTIPANRLTQSVQAPSCAPVQHANGKNASNPLLARYGMAFNASGGPMSGSGFVTLDGAAPGGYATSVVSEPQPPSGLLSSGVVSGVGVWFKVASGSRGPLLSFAASPSNGGGNADRAVYLDAAGKLNVTWNTAGSSIGPSSGTSYADGSWHFAYVTFGGLNVVILGLIPEVKLYVDGVERASTPSLSLSPLSSYGGYWHLGWAPTSVTGLSSAYLNGSLSNFVVLNNGTPPSGTTIGKPATQASFNSAISASVTNHWKLDDSGTSTFAGSLPPTMSAPCSKVDIGFGFTGPAATIGTQSLAAFANGVPRVVPAPAPATTQTVAISTSRGAGYHTDISGLHLYAPLTFTETTDPVSAIWKLTFSWADAASAFIG